MKLKENFIVKKVAGKTVVIPMEGDLNTLINLNETGAFLWRQLETGADEDELLNVMKAEYDADEETLKADITEFLSKLKENDFLE